MEVNLLDIGYRKKLINEIKSDENVQRKIVSYKKQNMQNDNFHQYVIEYLESKLDPETVNELTVFSNVNLQKRISKSEASVYKYGVERQFFTGNTELEEMHDVYDDIGVTTMLQKANEAYKYQDQCLLQIVPKDGCLKPRVLLPHHFDVIPDPVNPEKALGYIISNFDNTSRDKIRRDSTRASQTGFSQGDKYRDQVNQSIGDYDDSSARLERYYIWTNDLNFVMDGRGYILDKDTEKELSDVIEYGDPNLMSPLSEFEVMPFIDISAPKDFEYWVRSGDALYYATVIYNVILTSEFQVVEMQGHAQPYYKGDAEHMPENVRIGVDKMIHIPINPNNPVQAEFGFANPNSDLAGVREFRESWLASFLSSRGLDVSIVSGKASVQGATSGIEKLLQMIEKFDASMSDFAMFKKVEESVFKVVYHWIKALANERVDGNPVLSEVYQINLPDFNQSNLSIEFKKPEIVRTDLEILETLEKEIEMGLSSRVHALMEYRGMSLEQAQKRVKEIDDVEMQDNRNRQLPGPNPEDQEGLEF